MIIKREFVYTKPYNEDTLIFYTDYRMHTPNGGFLLFDRMFTNNKTEFELIWDSRCLSKSIHGHFSKLGNTHLGDYMFQTAYCNNMTKLFTELPSLRESVICDISVLHNLSVRFLSPENGTRLHVTGYIVVDD